MPARFFPAILLSAAVIALSAPAFADTKEVPIAVATNFADTVKELEPLFEAEYPYDLKMTTGSGSQLASRISGGEKFAVLLADDSDTAQRLVTSGDAVADSLFTYAVGRLTLWSPEPDTLGADGAAFLRKGNFHHLAIANPDTAPFGVAAKQALGSMGLYEALKDKIVTGDDVGQTFSIVTQGSAEVGMVSLSSVLDPNNQHPGAHWEVPSDLYAPIRQDAVLLKVGADDQGAKDFLEFLHSQVAQTLIQGFGYGLDTGAGTAAQGN